MLLEEEQTVQGERVRREDPRVTRTRQLLQKAFMELLMEKSFEAITIQDIAERATVNRVTFYAHFPDKYALLEYAIREMIRQRLRSQVPEEAPYTTDNLARLVQTVCAFLDEIGSHCPPPYGSMEPLMEKQIKAELYEILRKWLVERSGSAPTPEQGAMVASWAIYGAAVQWTQQKRRESLDDYVQQVLPLILGGLQLVID
jgi:AcrR family transcriptional regulator